MNTTRQAAHMTLDYSPASASPKQFNRVEEQQVRKNKPQKLCQRLAPATCGELMQGNIGGQDFLVNCPIERYAKATAFTATSEGFKLRRDRHFTKVKDALDLLEQYVQSTQSPQRNTLNACHQGREFLLESDIPRGKGMASSSSDIAAALAVACNIYNYALSPTQISEIIAQVEPSDHVHLSGISQVDHLGGSLLDSFSAPNDLSVIVVDCGGEVDTQAFDRARARALYKEQQDLLINTLLTLKKGLRRQDLQLIAQAATASARLNQEILPKAPFEALLACTRVHGALGLNCAHSGTVLGVLHRSSDNLAHKLWQQIDRHFGESVQILGSYRVISGGCRVC